MSLELVRARTRDGLRLDGTLQSPSVSSNEMGIDAIICVHGFGGNFYSSATIGDLVPAFLDAGVTIARVNTRGRDLLYSTAIANRTVQLGAAREIVDDCRHDLSAWIERLSQQGFSRIGLLGHSLGAIKILYSQALETDPRVIRLMAISPPRLSHTRFQHSRNAGSFGESVMTANKLVADGKQHELFHVEFPMPMLISASTFIDKYGDSERYDFLNFLAHIRVPTLFSFGSIELSEGGPAFDGLVESIKSRTHSQQQVAVTTVDGANHFYSGKTDQLATVLVDWNISFPAT